MRYTIIERKIADLCSRQRLMNANYDAYVKAGLRKSPEAKKCLEAINDIVSQRTALEEQDVFDRRSVAAHLLLCVAAADFACESADLFGKKVKQVFGEVQGDEAKFMEQLQKVAQLLAEIVTMMDKRTNKLSLNFAAMSDELMETLINSNLKTAAEVIQRHMDAGNGRGLMLTSRELKTKS